jgi:hypothetical protein
MSRHWETIERTARDSGYSSCVGDDAADTCDFDVDTPHKARIRGEDNEACLSKHSHPYSMFSLLTSNKKPTKGSA